MNIISAFLMSIHHLRSSCALLKEALVWVLSYIVFLYIFAFTLPFFIYRKLVTFLAKFYDKDITTIVTGLSTLFHRDFDCYDKKPLSTIVCCLRIKGGSLSGARLQQAFLEKVVHKKNPENGQLVYPELQQHFTRFMGYTFLKWDREFDISNHVSVYNDDNEMVVTKPILMELWQDLMIKPFPKGISPWEAILVENYVAERDEEENPDWIIFVRLHHGIGDGFCFEKVMSSLFDSDYVPDFHSVAKSSKKMDGESVGNLKTSQQIQNLMLNLQCLATGPYELFNRGIRLDDDFHALHVSFEKKSNEYFVVESPVIPVNEVKKIKQGLGIGFTTVLLGVAAGAVRKFLIRNNLPIPERYTTTMPFPSSDKRLGDGLGNDFFLAGIDLPIHLDKQKDRLSELQRSLENMRYSGFMKMLNLFMKQISNLPSVLLRGISRKSMFSATYSSIPGPDKVVRGGLGGCDLIEANFTHGLNSDSLGFAISTITFAGKLRMTFFVDRNLMGGNREMAEQFVECLMQEYYELKSRVLA